MFRITRREEIFFDMFVDAVKNASQSAELLKDLMFNYQDIENKIRKIEETEHEGDQQVHKILTQLNNSFITPIDREDIYLIAKELDNITDSIEATAHRFIMMNIHQTIPEAAKKMSALIVDCVKELMNVMLELKNMKKSKTLKEKIIEVNRIESNGDVIFRNAITDLFTGNQQPLEVIKWKEIYEYLENTLDACEDVANIVEGVYMKHA